MTGGVNIVLIGPLDGMEMVSHLSLVLIADWYLVANHKSYSVHCQSFQVVNLHNVSMFLSSVQFIL